MTSGAPIAVCCDVLEDLGIASSLTEAISICSHLGFTSIEISVQHATRFGELRRAVNLCNDLGLTICGLHNAVPRNVRALDDAGQPRAEFLSCLEAALRAAIDLRTDLITVGIGSSRSIPSGHTRAEAMKRFVDTVALLDRTIAGTGVKIGLEVIASRTAAFFTTASETFSQVSSLNLPWLGMTCDTFQSLTEGLDPAQEVTTALPRLLHVQVADSERRIPGSGSVDYVRLFEILQNARWGGWISIELKADTEKLHRTLDVREDLRAGLGYLRACWSQSQNSRANGR